MQNMMFQCRIPSNIQRIALLGQLISMATPPVYAIRDSLDECQSHPELLKSLGALTSPRSLRLFMTSFLEFDILMKMRALKMPFIEMEIYTDSINMTIKSYVQLQNCVRGTLKVFPQTFRDTVEQNKYKKAATMYDIFSTFESGVI